MPKFEPAAFFFLTQTAFLFQVFAGQFDALPWLGKDSVVAMPWWVFMFVVMLFGAVQCFRRALISRTIQAILGFLAGLSYGVFVWKWDNMYFKVGLVISFGLSNAIDRIILPEAAPAFRWKPPMALIGAVAAIGGRHLLMEGIFILLILLVFIAIPGVGIMVIDEAFFRLLRCGIEAQVLEVQPAMFFTTTLMAFLWQIYCAQLSAVPWLYVEDVVPVPTWGLAAMLTLLCAPHAFKGTSTSLPLQCLIGLAGGMSIGALVWEWHMDFKLALIGSFGIANAIDRIIEPSAATVFRWRPPVALFGAVLAIVGRHAATHGVNVMLIVLLIFIAIPAVGIMLVDEVVYRLLGRLLRAGVLQLQSSIYFAMTLSAVMLQICLAQFDMLPWLAADRVIPLPGWMLAVAVSLVWLPHVVSGTARSLPIQCFLGFACGLSMGVLRWPCGIGFTCGLVGSFGVANAIDRVIVPEAAGVLRVRPPTALVGALAGILGPQAATDGFGLALLAPAKFIAISAVGIVIVDEILYRSVMAVLDKS